MRFFRFFRPRPSATGNVQTSPGRPFKFYLSALAIFLLSFVASLYFFFPVASLRQLIEHEINGRTTAELKLKSLSLRFPPALKADDLSLRIDSPEEYVLDLKRVAVKPLWHTLVGGNPGLAVEADLLGGKTEGTIRRDGTLEARMSRIPFAAPLPSTSNLNIAGTLSDASFTGAVPLGPTTESTLDVNLEKVRITGLESAGMTKGELAIGDISLRGSGKGMTFKIDRLETKDGDLKISGSGTLLLVKPMERSRLNLSVVLSPTQTMDKDLTELLKLFSRPGRDGSFRFRVSGTFAAPSIK